MARSLHSRASVMPDQLRESCSTTLHLELESIVDRLVSILGCASSTRTHVLENLSPDRELLQHIDSTCVAARDALVAVTHLQLSNRQWLKSALAEPLERAAAEEQGRPTVRIPGSRR